MTMAIIPGTIHPAGSYREFGFERQHQRKYRPLDECVGHHAVAGVAAARSRSRVAPGSTLLVMPGGAAIGTTADSGRISVVDASGDRGTLIDGLP